LTAPERPEAERRAAGGWWFEDATPGALIEHPGARTIGRDEHVWLAWVTDNASDVHGDVVYAARTPFGAPLVLGALTVAVVDGLGQPAEWPQALAAGHALPGWQHIGLVAAVEPGATIRAVSRIIAASPFADGSGGSVQRSLSGLDEDGREVVRIDQHLHVPAIHAENKGLLTVTRPHD
jgi:acyl dehydratase